MYLMNKIKAAITWRIKQLRKQHRRVYWAFKRLFDFSSKEKIEGVSIVVVGRNDNYGGDFTDRLRTTLDWNLSILPNPELIYIEWNQVENRSSDCDWIAERYKNSKCYIVPNSIHKKRAEFPNKMPVMEYFGKNVGIRKASNKWIILINADVLLSEDVAKRIKRGLSPNYVYGTNYININWNKQPISQEFLSSKKNILYTFLTDKVLGSVVGNFVMTHIKNWEKCTGYDERLTNVRVGVDNNGKNNLIYKGIKPMVLGNHYHLDHNESVIHGSNATHGNSEFTNIPYANNENWGMVNCKEIQINSKIWQLEET